MRAARDRRDAAALPAGRFAAVARRVPIAAVVRRCVPFVFALVFFAAGLRRAPDFRAVVDRDAVVFALAPVFLRAAFLAVFAEAALRGARAAVRGRAVFLADFRFAAFGAVLLVRLLGLIARLQLAEPRVMHDFRELSLYGPMLYLG